MFFLPVRPGVELRIMEERHAEPFYQVVNRNREHLRKWLPWVESTNSAADVAAFARRGLDQYARNQGFHAGIWMDNRPAGCVGLKPVDWMNSRVEIGYWLAEDEQGKGVVTDSCRAIVRGLFEDWKLNRIEARVAVGNDRSAAVPTRLGFVLESVEREGSRLYDRLVDTRKFVLLRRQWAQNG
jgi:ribosomal-protein-serine acetyltransferase